MKHLTATENLAFAQVGDYIQLTKPRIVLLFGFTGFVAMVLEGSLLVDPLRLFMVLFGIILTAASANALNQYFDRDIDAVMDRTKKKRPIPQGKISPDKALRFALTVGTSALVLLLYFGNLHAAFWGLATIAFYIGIYTLWLKRRTPYNIVIGGAAGATAPLIGWAAATGHLSIAPWILFAVIFMWTPAHFWALALCVREEYAKVDVPMLPVVAGHEVTRKQIFFYTALTVPLTLALAFFADVGWVYFFSALGLGIEFLRKAWGVLKVKTEKSDWRMFGYSIAYLFALFLALMVDSLINNATAAEKIPQELEAVKIEEKLGAHLDLNQTFINEKGEKVPLRSVIDGRKPVLLSLAYYGCPNLCGLFFGGTVESLKNYSKTSSGALALGKDFQMINVSIDPREDADLAAQKKEGLLKQLDLPNSEKAWHFWVSPSEQRIPKATDDSNVKALASTVGFGYRYDSATSQFAHSAAFIVLTPEGKISRYLYGIEFQPKDLRIALAEARENKVGGIVDRVVDRLLLFCFNYDPKTRKYSLVVMNIVRVTSVMTLLVLAFFLLRSARRGRMSAGV